VSGWSAKRRLRMVDLPEPEGPEITMGRRSWVSMDCMFISRDHEAGNNRWS